jgi:hypothetical protein
MLEKGICMEPLVVEEGNEGLTAAEQFYSLAV